jgi:hypothetical protein
VEVDADMGVEEKWREIVDNLFAAVMCLDGEAIRADLERVDMDV